MTYRLLIDEGVFANRALLLRDEEPDQFALENNTQPSLTSAIFMGRVTAHLNDMAAAFVDIGGGKSGLLRAQDWVGDYDKSKPFSQQLTEGSLIPVQVTKDPVQDKAYQLSGYLSLEHPLIHLRGFSKNVQFAKSFTSDGDKKKLKQELETYGTGFLLRSRAAKTPTNEILAAAENLYSQWQVIQKKIKTADKVILLIPHPGFTERMVARFGKHANEINITPSNLAANLKKASPSLGQKIHILAGQLSALENFTLDELLETRLPLPNSGNITIEPTEALIAIDVNAASTPKEDANKQAAQLLSRQLRLRNLSGMILIDFAGHQSREESKKLADLLANYCNADPVRVEVLGSSSLGLMQLTRERVAAPLHQLLKNQITVSGHQASLSTLLSFETALTQVLNNKSNRHISCRAGANLYAVLGHFREALCQRYDIELKLARDDNLSPDAYDLTNSPRDIED